MQPRWYQQKLMDETKRAWDAGAQNVLVVSPPRSGKTWIAVWLSEPFLQASEHVCIMAHRQELIIQIAMTYAERGHYHNVIAPSDVVSDIIHRQIKEFGKSYVSRNGLVTVGSVDTINARAHKFVQWAARVKLWITDECFVAGTMVGDKPIEKVCVGDKVTSFDEQTGEIVEGRVTRTFKSPMPDEMVKVVSSHHVLYVTSGHPFWTKRGWVAAGELTDDDFILADTMRELRKGRVAHGRTAEVSVAQDWSHFLHSQVRLCSQGQEPRSDQKGKGGQAGKECRLGTTRRTETELFHLRSVGEPRAKIDADLRQDGTCVLLNDVQRRVSEQDVVGSDVSHQQEICVCQDDCKQPDGERGSAKQGVENLEGDWTSTEGAGWKRQTADLGGNSTISDAFAVGLSEPIYRQNRLFARDGSESLQDRLRAAENEDSNRSGRRKPRGLGTTALGSAQRRIFDWQGVDSVTVLKRGNPEIPGDGFVYNLEVDGYHTYTANGVVVHNCHHLLADNKWGKAIELFTSARGVGFTATPGRADRKSLARSQGGVFDAMAKGVTARQLIDEGYICDYDIIAPPASIDREAIKVGATGEFTQTGLSAAKRDSSITGDCVASYLQYTPGQQAIVFAVDIEHSLELCAAYEAAGVSAFAVSSKTAKAMRKQIMSKFERGVFRVLVNVDLFGEGLNVEGIEVVIMARPTQSYTLYVQQFFRALTRGSDKHKGTIIDHAGNVGYFGKFYGLPDSYNGWTLETEERGRRAKRDPNVVPVTTCTRTEPFICAKPYEAIHRACPHCGYAPEPASRSGPEYVAGDLIMLDAETLRLMRGEADKALWTPNREPSNPAETVMFRNQNAKVEAQRALRESIALWAGVWHDRGAPDSEIYRRFWFKFGTDILTAQSLGTRDATDLNERIRHDYHHT